MAKSDDWKSSLACAVHVALESEISIREDIEVSRDNFKEIVKMQNTQELYQTHHLLLNH